MRSFWLVGLAILVVAVVVLFCTTPSPAYIEAPHSFGQVVAQSTNIVVMRVEKVDKEKNLIIYRKVEDLKGKHPQEEIKHNIGKAGFHPREWQYSMAAAEIGRTAVFFHNGGASETYIGGYWYQAYAGGEWWNMSHGEPFLLRTYAGSAEKLIAAVREVQAGREVVVPCMIDNKDELHLKRGKIQRFKVSMKLQDYNPKRDFVGWGGEDFRRVEGMPGFTHISNLTRVDPEAMMITSADIDGDGKPDLCLVGGGKVVVLQNAGEAFNEISLPGAIGARSASWGDYNGDGLADLLVAGLNGPKLYTNLGKGNFRDDSHLLPREPGYNLTAAAFIDQDGDGKPDILLGNGFHGLRLYRNVGKAPEGSTPLAFGNWHYIGPFDNTGQQGFDRVYPPEKELDLAKKYPGKGNQEVAWKEGKFTDGQINNLAILPDNNDVAIYLYREITTATAMEMPASFGSDDTLTVWLNGEKLVAQNVYRGAAPDQAVLNLKLKPGKNQLLLKICQGQGDFAFYFSAKKEVPAAVTWLFQDVSEQVGLGLAGIGGNVKGSTLTVIDVNGDGRQDFLYGAGTGILVLNTPKGFVEVKDSGIVFKPGKESPVFGDFNGDGKPDLFIPQFGGCKLFRNDGNGKFTDVTAQSGDLAKANGLAASAAWGDVNGDGKLDLVVGYLRGPNRYFRNNGNGTFTDASDEIGLNQKIFNTQGVCLVDLNKDGILDMIFNNEGQDSTVLLSNPEWIGRMKGGQ